MSSEGLEKQAKTIVELETMRDDWKTLFMRGACGDQDAYNKARDTRHLFEIDKWIPLEFAQHAIKKQKDNEWKTVMFYLKRIEVLEGVLNQAQQHILKLRRYPYEITAPIQDWLEDLEELLGVLGENDPSAKIRKVKVLEGKLKEQAGSQGLCPEDLVIVTGDRLEKVEGDPVSFLLKRAGRIQPKTETKP